MLSCKGVAVLLLWARWKRMTVRSHQEVPEAILGDTVGRGVDAPRIRDKASFSSARAASSAKEIFPCRADFMPGTYFHQEQLRLQLEGSADHELVEVVPFVACHAVAGQQLLRAMTDVGEPLAGWCPDEHIDPLPADQTTQLSRGPSVRMSRARISVLATVDGSNR